MATLSSRINTVTSNIQTAKENLRGAIANKGVEVVENPTFQQLIDGVNNISTKAKINANTLILKEVINHEDPVFLVADYSYTVHNIIKKNENQDYVFRLFANNLASSSYTYYNIFLWLYDNSTKTSSDITPSGTTSGASSNKLGVVQYSQNSTTKEISKINHFKYNDNLWIFYSDYIIYILNLNTLTYTEKFKRYQFGGSSVFQFDYINKKVYSARLYNSSTETSQGTAKVLNLTSETITTLVTNYSLLTDYYDYNFWYDSERGGVCRLYTYNNMNTYYVQKQFLNFSTKTSTNDFSYSSIRLFNPTNKIILFNNKIYFLNRSSYFPLEGKGNLDSIDTDFNCIKNYISRYNYGVLNLENLDLYLSKDFETYAYWYNNIVSPEFLDSDIYTYISSSNYAQKINLLHKELSLPSGCICLFDKECWENHIHHLPNEQFVSSGKPIFFEVFVEKLEGEVIFP